MNDDLVLRPHGKETIGQFLLEIGVQLNLHRQTLEPRVLLDLHEIADGETDEQIHQQDRHDHGEEQQHEQIDVREMLILGVLDVRVIVVEFAQHHRHRFDDDHEQMPWIGRWVSLRKGPDDAEGQRKAQDQNGEQREHLQQCFHDFEEHDDIDAVDVEATEQEEQCEVGSEDADRARHPLVMPRLIEEKRQGEDTPADVERPLNVVLEIAEVVPAVLRQLNDFQDEVEETVENEVPDAEHLFARGALLKRDEIRVGTRAVRGTVPVGGIVMVARGKGDDEIGEDHEKEKVERQIQHVDWKAVREPLLSK